MYVDSHGVQVEPVRPIELTDEVVDRIRDVIALRLQHRGVSFRWIGRILGMSSDSAQKRVRRMPSDVRDHYRQLSLEELFGSSDE
jgi:hypothetical protein